MGRVAVKLSCSAEVQQELVRLSRSRTDEVRLVERAKMVLGGLAGKRNDEVARAQGIAPARVSLWRRRFAASGLSGLRDQARSGKPPTYPHDLKQRILRQLEQPPPAGFASWEGGSLAQALGVSAHIVWRILRQEGVQLRRQRAWWVSTDPAFATKAADLIGLYVSPPQNALVLCVDEQPAIQALARTTGYVQTRSGKIVRGLRSTYKRNGTLNLFAALEVATGAIHAQTTPTKKRPDLQAFLDDVVTELPRQREMHISLDNDGTHKKNHAWLASHPQVHFHFTPTSASWLTQVEIWFGIFSRKALHGASFSSTDDLRRAIAAFIAAYNPNASPFVWRKREVTGSQLRNTIRNLRN